ncbi:MAG: apolipoprotein N-acyltransferase [Ignavibacteriaceae bacterium]|jgi:apolipoprotein N-acyltransferase|nr:apolipoprotein N-acyltransferase [Ignavibacteriaceae bacterium]
MIKFFRSIPKTPDEKLALRNDRFLLILAGVLTGFAFPPIPFPVTAFFALVPLLMVLNRREKLIDLNRAAYFYGFVTGIISLYWVGAYTVAKDPFLMAGGGLTIFANPIFFIIPTTLYYGISRFGKIGKQNAIWFLPFFWASYEYFYMNIDLNFPWITLSNTMANFPVFFKIANVIGPLGMTVVLLFINIFIFKIWTAWKAEKKIDRFAVRLLYPFLLIPLLYGIFSTDTTPPKETLRVGLIQPNLDPYKKWAGGNLDEIIDNYFDLTSKAVKDGARIVMWPETALPVYLLNGQYDAQVLKIHNLVDSLNIHLMTGMPHMKIFQSSDRLPPDAKTFPDSKIRYGSYNSVLLFSPGDRVIQQYGKVKLVPFGERTPYIDQIPVLGDLLKWGVGISSWNVGQDTTVFKAVLKTSLTEREVKIGALVCFESVFPYYASELTNRGAEFFTVITNDSWYGNTSGPYQHKEFSTLRAIENNRAVVRAANGGISCLITADGKTISSTKMYESAVLVVDVPLQSGETVFVKTSSVFPYICYGISLFAVIFWIVGIIEKKRIKEKK